MMKRLLIVICVALFSMNGYPYSKNDFLDHVEGNYTTWFEVLDLSHTKHKLLAKAAPEGWIVLLDGVANPSIIFVPDKNHIWYFNMTS